MGTRLSWIDCRAVASARSTAGRLTLMAPARQSKLSPTMSTSATAARTCSYSSVPAAGAEAASALPDSQSSILPWARARSGVRPWSAASRRSRTNSSGLRESMAARSGPSMASNIGRDWGMPNRPVICRTANPLTVARALWAPLTSDAMTGLPDDTVAIWRSSRPPPRPAPLRPV